MKWLKTKEVRKRVTFTLFIILLFQLGTFIPLPYIKGGSNQNALTGLFNLFSGGAFGRAGILMLGISPYITSSIIFQLLQSSLPSWKAKSKTVDGRNQLGQWQRITTMLFAGVQAYTFLFTSVGRSIGLVPSEVKRENFIVMLLLITGALFASYLGSKIDEDGVGQGASVLIATGILANLIFQGVEIANLYPSYVELGESHSYFKQLAILMLLFGITFLLSYFANKKEFRYPIQSMQNKEQVKAHYFPIKLLASSVMPIIFSTSTLALLGVANSIWNLGIDVYLDYSTNRGLAVYVFMIFLFAFIFNYIQIDGDDIQENFQQSGIYLLGVKPSETSKFIRKELFKITLLGTPVIAFIATFAIILERLLDNQFGLSMISMSLLILIGVGQEIAHQISGLTDKHTYKELF